MRHIEPRAIAGWTYYEPGDVLSFADLNEQHQRIARLIAVGFSDAEIARRMFLARQTVKNHCSAIYDAVGVPRRADGYSPRAYLTAWYWKQQMQ